MSLAAPLVSGFLLGLSTGPVCLVTCVPLALPFALPRVGIPSRGSWPFLLRFLAGRFVSYSAIGLAVGLTSSAAGLGHKRVLVAVWTGLSLALIAYGLSGEHLEHGLCGRLGRFTQTRIFPFLMGLATGLSVCPPLVLAVAYGLERTGQAVTGLAFFVSFFAATTLWVLPLGFLGYLPSRAVLERAGRGLAVVAGVAVLIQGIRELIP